MVGLASEQTEEVREQGASGGSDGENLKIDLLLGTVRQWEQNLEANKVTKTAQHLISLYNKTIEYYAAANMMDESQIYLQKLKSIFNDPELQTAIAQSDI